MPVGSHDSRPARMFLLIVAALLTLLIAQSVVAQGGDPQLYVKVGDTTGYYGEKNSVITVYLDNYEEEVGAFTLWIRLSRTDLAKFQTDIDTVIDTLLWHCTDGTAENCLDWEAWVESIHGAWDPNFDFIEVDTTEALIGDIDTVGTLIQGWEYVATRNIDDDGNDVRVTGIANLQGDGHFTPGIAPQTGGILFKLHADILDEPEEPDDLPRATLQIIDDAKQYFLFSRPDGTAISYYPEEVPDTNYFVCLDWDGGTCIDWEATQTCTPCDSTEYTTQTIAVLDRTEVLIFDGSITALIRPLVCGNVDNDPDGFVDISDILMLARYSLLGGQEPEHLEVCNVDCDPDGFIDISDILVLARFSLLGGAEPCSEVFNGGCVP